MFRHGSWRMRSGGKTFPRSRGRQELGDDMPKPGNRIFVLASASSEGRISGWFTHWAFVSLRFGMSAKEVGLRLHAPLILRDTMV